MEGSCGFRCVSRIFRLIRDTLLPFIFPTPAFSTARDWLLKLGLFNLTKPHQTGEWVWIVDCSIQMGAMKCLLILGVRMEILREKGDFTLSYSDVEPLVLKTLESCPGEAVKIALEEAKSKTGQAVAIVSDEGAELKRGVRLFQQTQTETHSPIHLHDIMHKMDLILKKELEEDSDWKKFIHQMTNTTQQLKLTSSSHLVPPRQRQKKRMRSEVDIIEWGSQIIHYLDSGKANALEKEKLAWVQNYRLQISVYYEMAQVFDITTQQIRTHGYHQETIHLLKKSVSSLLTYERSQVFFSKVIKTVKQETDKLSTSRQLPGSSEVIESVFGKFKQLEKKHSYGGLTSLVLSLPAFLGEITQETIKAAMETISIGKVKAWVQENLGCTFWSQRRCALNKNEVYNKDYLESDESNNPLIA